MTEELNQKLKKYFSLTREALEKVKVKENLDKESKKKALELLNLSKSYYEDAKHFEKQGNLLNAYGAVCYAHSFLDSGAILGLFDVDDDRLFMVDRR
ncbi:DUF357 domain-containing protein [Candidatus Woesearchaeota archaeon]|nr:DUF357 domain-containing protein [Candidatus Woesearchaeota archaeon]